MGHGQSSLESGSSHDALTGLLHRSFFIQHLKHLVVENRWLPQHRFAVLYLGLDRFRLVNDGLGYTGGDKLLAAVAQRLNQNLGALAAEGHFTTYIAARMGSDEFAVLLDDLSDQNAVGFVADSLRKTMTEPYTLDQKLVVVPASIGVTAADERHDVGDDPLGDADIAMTRAKASGGASVVVFDLVAHAFARHRFLLESDLRDALKKGQLRMVYQPVVSLESGAVQGFEALMRWQHPDRGPVSPADFIAVAEESDLINTLGEWALHQACAQLACWRKAVIIDKPLSMSVNLSCRQLNHPALVDLVDSIIRQAGVPHDAIHLEITETAVMRDLESLLTILEKLKRLSIKLDMDDFGTGYSSLSNLHRIPLDRLKIDRSFVKNMAARREYTAVVAAIATLAHNLNISVVAEGVETIDQVAQLQALDCDQAQGYHFARPLESDQAQLLLENPRQ